MSQNTGDLGSGVCSRSKLTDINMTPVSAAVSW